MGDRQVAQVRHGAGLVLAYAPRTTFQAMASFVDNGGALLITGDQVRLRQEESPRTIEAIEVEHGHASEGVH